MFYISPVNHGRNVGELRMRGEKPMVAKRLKILNFKSEP